MISNVFFQDTRGGDEQGKNQRLGGIQVNQIRGPYATMYESQYLLKGIEVTTRKLGKKPKTQSSTSVSGNTIWGGYI